VVLNHSLPGLEQLLATIFMSRLAAGEDHREAGGGAAVRARLPGNLKRRDRWNRIC